MNLLDNVVEILGDLIQASFDAGFCKADGEENIYSYETAMTEVNKKRYEIITIIENILKGEI